MNTIFMNFENSKISDSHRLLLNLLEKIIYKGVINVLIYQVLAYTMQGKMKKVIQKQ